jgi:hypothetical protein
MNARIETVMNSRNLGARITENRALDKMIWAFEAFNGKTVFFGGSGQILEFLEWMDGLDSKDRGSYEILRFFRDFVEFKKFRVG